jgi:hypothetical protein
MALPIRDGNQSLTTLSTILVSNSHIPAHTVISFGTQGITDIATAVSGVELGPNTLNALENITVTLGQVTITGGLTDAQLRASAVTISGTVTVGSIVTHGVTIANSSVTIGGSVTATISGTPSVTFSQASVTFGTAVITGSTSIIGTPSVTFTQIATHGVTIGSGTAQIGSVTASISGTVPISISSVTVGNSVTIGSLPAISGTVTIGNSITISSLPAIAGTVTANVVGTNGSGAIIPLQMAFNDEGFSDGRRLAVSIVNSQGEEYISGTVTANLALIGGFPNAVQLVSYSDDDLAYYAVAVNAPDGPYIPTRIVGGTVTIGSALPAGTNRIGVVTIGAGTVTIGAGTAQIGSVTASISNFPATQAVSLTTLPALVAGTAQIGSVTASISGTVTIFPVQGTSVTTSNFTSTTPSQTIASASSGREILTIFNEGAGNLHVCAGSTCTTIGYQVRLSSGDYWECPASQVQLIHTAVFATTGTARVTEIG